MSPPRRYAALEDRALLALTGEGDGSALHALYERYGPASHALARRILGDDRLAADVVREVFLAVWSDGGRPGPGGSAGAWVLALTHARAVELVRRTENLRRRRAAVDDVAAAGPDGGGWSELRRARVRAVLDELPAAARETLAFAYFGGYTQREVATLTGASLGEVRARLLDALRELRPLVDDTAGRAL